MEGNTVVERGYFLLGDGTALNYSEVLFAVNGHDTDFELPENFSFDPEVFLLPNLIGYGLVSDLSVSMTLRADLLDRVQQLVNDFPTLTDSEFDVRFDELVKDWTGAADVDPNQVGSSLDAQKVLIINKMYGIGVFSRENPLNPNAEAIAYRFVEEVYAQILADLKGKFLVQLPLFQILNGVNPFDVNPDVANLLAFEFSSKQDRLVGYDLIDVADQAGNSLSGTHYDDVLVGRSAMTHFAPWSARMR